MSEPTAELLKALLDAQKAFPSIEKGATAQVGQRNYDYADLATTLQHIEPVLHENGLCLYHRCIPEGLETVLAHPTSSGTLRSVMPIDWEVGAQQVGSQITYYRRYAVHAMLSLRTGDDDDGDAAQKGSAPPPPRKAAPAQPAPQPPRQSAAPPAAVPPDGSVEPWMHDVVGFGKHKERTWFELANGSENGEAHSYLKWGVRNFDNAERLSKAQACIEMLEARVAGQKAAERAEADALPPVGEGVESVF